MWFYLQSRFHSLPGNSRLLHFAPEECFIQRLHDKFHPRYITADLSDPKASHRIDITDIPYTANSFDLFLCNHVLEHVADDWLAIAELHRVTKIGGWGIVTVPILAKQTIEDESITSPQDRLRLYGQSDHVRAYGKDFSQRLIDGGFDVSLVSASDLISDPHKYALASSGSLFICQKNPS
jgi:predicted SAM-dependent methyltransferase